MAAEVGNRSAPTGTKAGSSSNSSVGTVTERSLLNANNGMQSVTHQTQSRPPFNSQQSNSLPSTPLISGKEINGDIRTPSPVSKTGPATSPRTARSETDSSLRASRGLFAPGCRYESGIMHFKRRIPYNIGSDQLVSSSVKVKKHLLPDEEKKLTGDMRELFDRLQPTKESEKSRATFVKKLETLLNERWPGNEIKVHVFGSSGNSLFTNDSDVDICITTKGNVLQRTCLLAKALGEHGMKDIECRPNAKVPIVKIWDPELNLACDMNVNNTAALNNTEMMKAYVEMDPRVRPLAMIIKYWTRRRILNDAALGGTLSSYTWLCMIVNFLQCRHPKILPSLQKEPYFEPTPERPNGFCHDSEALKDFGRPNRESLGDLLFGFFRRYAHEVDYERYIISVREGALIPKHEKHWHIGQNTRLCVEEPFNTERNLGNTADDTSFRGVHLELRRAFDLISQGKLEECFEEYIFPPQEERIFTKPIPQPRPVLTRSQSQTGSNRIPRGPADPKKATNYQGQRSKNGNSNRRASSAVPPHKMPNHLMPYYDMSAGSQLHDTLAQQYQRLQRQEQHLRAKMQQSGGMPNQTGAVHLMTNGGGYYVSTDPLGQVHGESYRRNSNASRTPQQLPLQQFTPLTNVPGIANFLPPGFLNSQTGSPQTLTNPPSPSLGHIQPGYRGSTRRAATVEAGQHSAARSHSQPPANHPPPGAPGVYYTHDGWMVPEWQGSVLGQRSLQDIQQEYMLLQQRRADHTDGTYSSSGTEVNQYDSPVLSYDFDNVSAQEDQILPDDSVSNAGFPRNNRSATLPHIINHIYTYRQQDTDDITTAEEQSPPPPPAPAPQVRPRASSTIASHGISFFADEAADSPPPRFSFPVRSVDVRSWSAGSAGLNGDISVVDGSEASEYATTPEHSLEVKPNGSTCSSDIVMTPSSLAATPTQEPIEFFDGSSDRSSGSKPLPSPIQFGQFPARAPFRTGQQPKPDDIRGNSQSSGSGRSLYSHTLSGLGINMSNGSSRDHTTSNGTGAVKQSSTVAGLNLASTLKTGNLLSPVREVRTPSPTATRSNGLFTQAQQRTPAVGPSVVQHSRKAEPSPLASGATTYARAHQRARSVESANRKSRKPAQDSLPDSSKNNTTQKSQLIRPGHSKPIDPPPKPVQQQNSVGGPSTSSTTQNGGWQQSGSTKKKKSNKKAASVGSIVIPLDSSERKGG